MRKSDSAKFGEIIAAMYEMRGKPVSPGVVKLWWNALAEFEFADVEAAMGKLSQESRYLPMPADVIDILDPPQWPTAAEAWGIYPQDERDTGAVCDETLAAWASAEALYFDGDVIGARRAFEGAYERHMAAAKANGARRPTWRLSLGWDADARERGAQEAMRLGLLDQSKVAGYLPDGQEKRNGDNRIGSVRAIGELVVRPSADGAERDISERVGRVERGKKT